MAVYKNRNVWDENNDMDIYVELGPGQVVLQQKGIDEDHTDIIVVSKTDVPKLIEALQKFKPNVQLHNNE
jgi:hypothetical protein